MRRVDESARDQAELNFLVGIQDQHAALNADRNNTHAAYHRLMHGKSPGAEVKGATDVEVETEDVGIRMRSPQTTVTNHYGGGGLGALLAVAVLAAAVLAAAWLLSRPGSPSPDRPGRPPISRPGGEDYQIDFFDP